MENHALALLSRSSQLLVLVLVASLLAGCYPTRRGEPLTGPMKLDTALLEGRHLFDAHCYKCHGEGEGALGPSFNDKPLPRPLMRFQVRHGLGAMPGFDESHISDEELDRLLDYIVALRRHGQ